MHALECCSAHEMFTGHARSGSRQPQPGARAPARRQSTLDKGMAKSVFEQKTKFIESIVRLYPQLKKAELEFGYKVGATALIALDPSLAPSQSLPLLPSPSLPPSLSLSAFLCRCGSRVSTRSSRLTAARRRRP